MTDEKMVDGIFPQKAIGHRPLFQSLRWGGFSPRNPVLGMDCWRRHVIFLGLQKLKYTTYLLSTCVCVCSLNIFLSTSSYDSLMLLETSWNRDFTICIYWSIIIRYDQLFVSLEAAKPSGFRCFIWRHQSQKHPRAGGKRCEVDAERGLYILISGDS